MFPYLNLSQKQKRLIQYELVQDVTMIIARTFRFEVGFLET